MVCYSWTWRLHSVPPRPAPVQMRCTFVKNRDPALSPLSVRDHPSAQRFSMQGLRFQTPGQIASCLEHGVCGFISIQPGLALHPPMPCNTSALLDHGARPNDIDRCHGYRTAARSITRTKTWSDGRGAEDAILKFVILDPRATNAHTRSGHDLERMEGSTRRVLEVESLAAN
jgi:hypothetical protein